MNAWLLAGTTFIACGVEAVEAATIVLAVALTSGWKSAALGTVAALLALAVATALGAPLLERAASLAWIELAVGLFLIYFGFTWLRKAVLRYAGRKSLHDEAEIFDHAVAALRLRREARHGVAVAFQGVFTEGLEVVIIVITFAATSPQNVGWSLAGALGAVAVVALTILALHKPLTRVPENALKAIVGVMLLSLGTLWAGDGVHVRWPLGDATLFAFAAAYAAAATGLAFALRRSP